MFVVEKSDQRGSQGGKLRGFCLSWRGRGYAPQGRSQRSGWYLHRDAAENAARVANEAVAQDNARPVRQPEHKGDGSHMVRLIDPQGAVHWIGRRGDTPDGQEATRFNNLQAAGRALSDTFGHGPAFWNSERASQASKRDRMRGWQGSIVADAELVEA